MTEVDLQAYYSIESRSVLSIHDATTRNEFKTTTNKKKKSKKERKKPEQIENAQ